MNFKLLRKEVLKESDKRYTLEIKDEEHLKKLSSSYGKVYTGSFEQQKKKLIKFISNRKQKYLDEELNLIKSVEESKDFNGELIITLEWSKSRMWGMNPRASTNYGFIGGSISGCGYCKTSTATAEALNDHKPILKLLYAKEEQRLRKRKPEDRRAFVGYGSGYSALPRFEGGVGVSSHETIIKNLGLNMRCITSTKQTDVYLIKK